MPTTDFYILLISFFLIAMVYASVGFGGGSSYLALLALVGVGFEVIRPTALLCNIVVVTGGVYIFYREVGFEFRKIWPFIVTSIPLAFLGGYWKIEEETFFVLLGGTLVVAGVFLWIQPGPPAEARSGNTVLNLGLGGGVGFLSGLVGIGGGIFLSPILHFSKWDVPKRISAMTSLFILVNSISGLAGQLARTKTIEVGFILPLLAAVLVGGQIGARLGARRFNPLYIRRVTAILVFLAGLNILKDHW